jgi:hypothetical protein
MLKVAVIYNDDANRVLISFEPETFTKLLESYYKETKSIKKAMKAIEVDLKKKTMYK